MTAGRPTKLTPETQKTICTWLAASVPVRWACEMAGIHYTTHYDWVAQGEEWLDHDPTDVPPEVRHYVEYSHATRRAKAEGLGRPAAELYRLIMNPATREEVRLRGLQFLLTHADREHWHPVQHQQPLSDDVVEVELAWDN